MFSACVYNMRVSSTPGTVVLISAILGLSTCVNAVTELLHNADFEVTNVSKAWTCHGGCTLTSSKDKYSRYHSVMVTDRHSKSDGLAQSVHVTGNNNYNLTGYIKLLTLPHNAMYDSVELTMKCSTPSHPHGTYILFGKVLFIPHGEWTKIGGAQYVPSGAHNCHIYVQVDGSTTEYVIDHMTLRVIPRDPQWETKATDRIEKIRKADISVSLTGGHGAYDVELKQTNHEFAFGSAVNAQAMYDPAYKNYQDCFYDNFNWAVLANALKWNKLERHHNQANFTTAMTAVHALRNHGIKVRGHNLFWGIERHLPSWLVNMTQTQIETEMQKHTNSVIGTFKGMLEHWDVNNENLHGDWYEQKLHDANATMQMFRDVHKIDQNVKLFLNDYGIMESGLAMALRNQAIQFEKAGVPIYGVGIQSHFHSSNFDMDLVKTQLDLVAEAGLPIWITELTVYEKNATKKAAALQNVLKMYFSHPAVEGILLWGFWDHKIFHKEASLFDGTNLTPNAAGTAYQTLYKSTWRTHMQQTIQGHATLHKRGFKGDYSLTVSRDGHQIVHKTFTLDSAGKNIHIDLGSGAIVG